MRLMTKFLISICILYWINLITACSVKADFMYNLQATLSPNSVVEIEQEPHYYEMFHIYADGAATVTFDNYNANLISPYDNGEYSDPYLYLYILDAVTFNTLNTFSPSYVLYDEDDDGNEDLGNGLYFYLEDVTFTNQLLAMVTSYEPMTTGTVDFNLYSDEPLNVYSIPEPTATALILLSGSIIFLARQKSKH